MSQISNVLIPCFVIQQNNEQFIVTQGVVGEVRDVPCRNSLIDDILYWASPIKDDGMFTGWQYRLQYAENLAKPTFDSFLVQRVRDKLSGYTWWIYVTSKDDFKNSCNTCCGDAALPMPGVNGSFRPVIAPCQELCDMVNVSGQVYAIFGIPTVTGAQYYPVGSFNNSALPTAPTSYNSIAALLVFLNASWTNVGSPNKTFVWTASGNTLTATGGVTGDELCVTINAVVSSP